MTRCLGHAMKDGRCVWCGTDDDDGSLCPAAPKEETRAACAEYEPPDVPHRFVPRPRNPLPLGDYTERMLSAVGVTKERYAEAKRRFGLASTCGCQKRQDWMNRVGAWIAGAGD